MAIRHCPECQSPLSSSEIEFRTCEACGARLPAAWAKGDDNDDDHRPRSRRTAQLRSTRESDHEDLMKQAKKQASITLFVVAALLMVCGTISVVLLGNQENAAEEETIVAVVLVAGMAALFAGLGFWAMYMPIPPATIGLILFIGLSILDIVFEPAAAKSIVVRVFIVVMLIRAINNAVKASKLAPKQRDYEDDYDDEPRRPRRSDRDAYDD
ncbi:zinc ribbon domain-containing protein [Zavarzinella formosa]|uniref:zinc ribbon domain-containing protein n=1 Tax=Zavarzinella formosa TaxID=360055 RepID=UPI0002F7B3DD|nr:zinc ribbon domain-containing protein [Zavarzinella formosa]